MANNTGRVPDAPVDQARGIHPVVWNNGIIATPGMTGFDGGG